MRIKGKRTAMTMGLSGRHLADNVGGPQRMGGGCLGIMGSPPIPIGSTISGDILAWVPYLVWCRWMSSLAGVQIRVRSIYDFR